MTAKIILFPAERCRPPKRITEDNIGERVAALMRQNEFELALELAYEEMRRVLAEHGRREPYIPGWE